MDKTPKCATCDGMGVVQVASPTDQDDGTALCQMCDGFGEDGEFVKEQS